MSSAVIRTAPRAQSMIQLWSRRTVAVVAYAGLAVGLACSSPAATGGGGLDTGVHGPAPSPVAQPNLGFEAGPTPVGWTVHGGSVDNHAHGGARSLRLRPSDGPAVAAIELPIEQMRGR